MSGRTISLRASKTTPCPVCWARTKGCSITDDGLHLCRGTPHDPAQWRQIGALDAAGYHHYRRAHDRHHERNGKPRPKPQTPQPRDWTAEARHYAAALTPSLRAELAATLGLPAAALGAIDLIGWTGDAWTLPERDGRGRIIGISTRDRSNAKRCIRGSSRGLTVPTHWRDRAGPVVLVEGASDTIAMTWCGLAAVGRPSNTGGIDHLAELLRDVPTDRPVVVLGERDQKADGSWPGREGAERTAAALTERLRRPVGIAYPPDGSKDARAWICDMAAGMADAEDWPGIGAAIVRHVTASAAAARDREPHTVTLSDVVAVDVAWLWPDRIPLGRITVIAGRPGSGKSMLSLDIAARVTRGLAWPDGTSCPAGSVLLLAAEDDLADTIRPRLNAADADARRVVALQGVQTLDRDGRKSVTIVTLSDLDAIETALDRMPDCLIIIIDPIGSYLGRGTDAHRDNEVRAVLAPLAALAARRGIAVVVVAHTRKGGSATHADDAVLGSVAFTGLARSVLHVVTDPDDHAKRRKLVMPGKNNLAPPTAGLAMRIEGRPPRIEWEDGAVVQSADEVLAAASRPGPEAESLRAAVDWLRGALAAGPRPAKEVQEEATQGEGLSVATLRRAREAAQVQAYRPAIPGPWWWRLPAASQDAHEPEHLA